MSEIDQNTEAELSERAQHLLKVLIERYTESGQPVGSRVLARDAHLDLSPATIRNVMADLEDLGFVRSPHTSAGRIPTVQGYRFFVDSLLKVQTLDRTEVERMSERLDPDMETKDLMDSVSGLLSGITKLAGVVTLPRHEHAALRQIDFLPLSQNRVLAILVIDDREVQNRILHTDRPFGRSELEQAANYLNHLFAGKDITDVRRVLIREMRDTRENMNRLMATAIDFAEQVFRNPDSGDDYILAGQINLMECQELGDVEKLRVLFEAFSEKRDILHLLDRCLQAEGMHIFIGEESGFEVLDECSVVTAPYSVDGQVIGVLGVIGPTRMAYNRVIPIVDATARLVGAALKPRE